MKIPVDYSFVDLNPKLFDVAERLDIKFYQQSFNFFAQNFNQKYDILICNEALDMWPGPHVIFKNGIPQYQVMWQLKNFDTGSVYSKHYLKNTLPLDSCYWEKVYLTVDNAKIYSIPKDLCVELITFPQAFKHLSNLSRIGGIIQDYWSIEEENPLRVGLTQKDCQTFIQKYACNKHLYNYITYFKKMLTTQSSGEIFEDIDENEKILLSTLPAMIFMKYWFESPLIPYGSVDITYSPNVHVLTRILSRIQYRAEVMPLDELIKRFIPVEESEFYNVSVENESVVLFEHIH